jgi:hypothetical protein
VVYIKKIEINEEEQARLKELCKKNKIPHFPKHQPFVRRKKGTRRLEGRLSSDSIEEVDQFFIEVQEEEESPAKNKLGASHSLKEDLRSPESKVRI